MSETAVPAPKVEAPKKKAMRVTIRNGVHTIEGLTLDGVIATLDVGCNDRSETRARLRLVYPDVAIEMDPPFQPGEVHHALNLNVGAGPDPAASAKTLNVVDPPQKGIPGGTTPKPFGSN